MDKIHYYVSVERYPNNLSIPFVTIKDNYINDQQQGFFHTDQILNYYFI